jgi:hypothetical protein
LYQVGVGGMGRDEPNEIKPKTAVLARGRGSAGLVSLGAGSLVDRLRGVGMVVAVVSSRIHL